MADTSELFRLDGSLEKDPAIEAWLERLDPELGALAQRCYQLARNCATDVRECFHDNWAVLCLGEFPFAYVAAYRAHVNVGFFQGASLPDPSRLLEGSGKRMRHVKVKPEQPFPEAALSKLIVAAYADLSLRLGDAGG